MLDNDLTVPLIGVIASISRQLADLRDQAKDPCRTPSRSLLFAGEAPDFSFLDTHSNHASGASDAYLNNDARFTGPNPLEKAIIVTMRFSLVLQAMAPLSVDWDNLMDDNYHAAAPTARLML